MIYTMLLFDIYAGVGLQSPRYILVLLNSKLNKAR